MEWMLQPIIAGDRTMSGILSIWRLRTRRFGTGGLLVAVQVLTGIFSQSVTQAAPVVEFDFGRTVECREVMALELGEELPGQDEKLIEMKLRVSVRLLSGKLKDVKEIRLEISDGDGRMRVHDFLPTTRLESLLTDQIEWTRTMEKNKEMGVSLGGEAPLLLGEVVAHVTPSLNGSMGQRELITEKKHRMAPKYLVVSSGTVGREHGVFFKMRASSQSSLEGVHELTIRFIVPHSWRGDAVRVSCQATGQQKILWLKKHKVWAHTIAPVALYLAGDPRARRAAERYVRQ
jgi:hypothetical protein